MQIGDQLSGHAKSELETDVAVEIAGSAQVDSWLGSSTQADLGAQSLEMIDEEQTKTPPEKDDDDLIENQHSIKDMDSYDVLAYSGQISGEFQSTEAPKVSSASKEQNPAKTTTSPDKSSNPTTNQQQSLAETKTEKIPKKLSINVDPNTATESAGKDKPYTVVSDNNKPANAVAKQIPSSHKKLRQQQDDIMKEIADIQKQEDLEDAKIKEEENEVDEKKQKLESAQEKLKQTTSKIAALEGSVHLHVISNLLNTTQPVEHKQPDEVSKKTGNKDKKMDSKPVSSLPTSVQQVSQNSTNSTAQPQSLITVTVDTLQSQSKEHDESPTVNKGIYFPSGNIATPISHPLTVNDKDKKENKPPQGLDQVKDEHEKLKKLSQNKVEQAKPKQASQSLVQATAMTTNDLKVDSSEEKSIQAQIASIKAHTAQMKQKTLLRKQQMEKLALEKKKQVEAETEKAQKLAQLKIELDEKKKKEQKKLEEKKMKEQKELEEKKLREMKVMEAKKKIELEAQKKAIEDKQKEAKKDDSSKPSLDLGSVAQVDDTKNKTESNPKVDIQKPSLQAKPAKNTLHLTVKSDEKVEKAKENIPQPKIAVSQKQSQPKKKVSQKSKAKVGKSNGKKTISLKTLNLKQEVKKDEKKLEKEKPSLNHLATNSTKPVLSKKVSMVQKSKTISNQTKKKPQAKVNTIAQNLINSVKSGQTSIEAAILAAAANGKPSVDSSPAPAIQQDDEEVPELTYEQAIKLKQQMDLDTKGAVEEGIQEISRDSEDDKRAEAEAARDLGIEPSDSAEYDKKFGDNATSRDFETSMDKDVEYTANRISSHNTLNDLIHKNSIQSLTQSSSGLDSLIGASVSTEISDNDTEYLKKLSERVAEEADQSDHEAKKREFLKEAIERAKKQHEDENSNDAGTMSVKHARELAARMNAELDAGVAQAETRNVLANMQFEKIKQEREEKEKAKKDPFNILHSMIKQKQSLQQVKSVEPSTSGSLFSHPAFTRVAVQDTGFSL